MTLRHLAVIPAAAMLLVAVAPGHPSAQTAPAAQQPAATGGLSVKGLRELDDNDRTANWNGLAVDELDDMDVVNGAGETIGEIEEVLADAQGNVVAVTVEVGGFLGLGEREVVVSTEHLELQGDRFMSALTAEQLEALPRWDDD